MAGISYNHSVRGGLWFSIEVEKDEFLVFISSDALGTHFQAEKAKEDPAAAYRANRSLIDSVARHKFLSGSPRPIRLGAADF